ncbi:hypothetical protein AX17_002454 [Amanita inopinata Kibby_2008]|nr:hypothetical protein AX17_002454 [Amanita inopinata Kibby_2008]
MNATEVPSLLLLAGSTSASVADTNIADVATASCSLFKLPNKRPRDSSYDQGVDLSVLKSRRKQLRVEIPDTLVHSHGAHSNSTPATKESPWSLFSEISEAGSLFADIPSSRMSGPACPSMSATSPSASTSPKLCSDITQGPALLTAPPIPGLYFNPTLRLSQELAKGVVDFCHQTYFRNPNVNQVMLFGRLMVTDTPGTPCEGASPVIPDNCSSPTGLPVILVNLLSTLSVLLKPYLPSTVYSLLFPISPTQARQAIINLYAPGEGISPHVDLLRRYGDGIIGVSFGSGCVMRFDKEKKKGDASSSNCERDRWDVYLPERSVIVLGEEARYDWTHGIDRLTRDYVSVDGARSDENGLEVGATTLDGGEWGRWIERGVRLSVTFRWLLPGADVVGPSEGDIQG